MNHEFKFKVGDVVRFHDYDVTALITSIDTNNYRYHYTFLTHYRAYLVNTQYFYPAVSLEDEAYLIPRIYPNEIWKELNES